MLRDTSGTEAFCDRMFAIAVSLLVLDPACAKTAFTTDGELRRDADSAQIAVGGDSARSTVRVPRAPEHTAMGHSDAADRAEGRRAPGTAWPLVT